MQTLLERRLISESVRHGTGRPAALRPRDRSYLLFTKLSQLTNAELDALEDDLDFFAFTGFKSKRVAELSALLTDEAS